MPRITRPLARWSRVSTCIAIDVGVRPDICTIDVPSRIRDVSRPHQANGVKASDPQASAVKMARALDTLTDERGARTGVTNPIVGTINLYQVGEWAASHVGRHHAQATRALAE